MVESMVESMESAIDSRDIPDREEFHELAAARHAASAFSRGS